MGGPEKAVTLLSRAGSLIAGIPVSVVIEVMRPLPVNPVPRAPGFVDGISIIRGIPTPVVRIRRLFAESDAAPGRLILVRTGPRQVALAVDAVLDLRSLPRNGFGAMPPLLGAASRDIVGELTTLDGELIVLLETARIVPDALFEALSSEVA